MREFEQRFPEWRQQIEAAQIYPERNGEVVAGTQFDVYMPRGIDFVIKIPKDPVWIQGYWLVEELAFETAIPFARVSNMRLSIDRQKKIFPEAIVQLKVPEVLTELGNAFTQHDIEKIESLAVGTAENDKVLFKKGIYVPDPTFVNFGIDKNGQVKSLDSGSARINFTGDQEYSGLAFQRARSHYANFLMLRFLEGELRMAQNSASISEQYATLVGIQHHKYDNTENFDQFILKTEPTSIHYDSETSLLFARLGHEEFVRRAPNGAPFELNENFIRNLPESLNS